MLAPTPAAPQLTAKVLVLDDDAAHKPALKAFCDTHGLAPLKAHAGNLMAVLGSNLDLGAVLLAETPAHGVPAALARQVHQLRPELPIFLRRERVAALDDLPAGERALFCAAYTADALQTLGDAVERWLFSRLYPNALVRGIAEISTAALASQFRGMQVTDEPPYLVRDRLIHGELYTLIPLESQWCRGYMTLQAREDDLLALVRDGRTGADPAQAGIRTVNHVFGEVTNLIWGGFKNRFVAYEDINGHVAQVPIVVNHAQRYISFGSEDPQLCFCYRLHDNAQPERAPVTVVQRFIFNLNWSPEDFRENRESLDALVEAGELELF